MCLSIVMLLTLSSCQQESKQANLQRILDRGYVSVGTIFGPTSYYVEAEGPAGFEYELAKRYADYIGVELKIIPTYSLDELFDMLDAGQVDFLAAGLSVTENRRQKNIVLHPAMIKLVKN